MAFTIKNFLFLGISLGLILPATMVNHSLEDKGIILTQVNDVLSHPKNKLFFIKNVSYQPERNLFSNTSRRNGGRSNKFMVEHTFVTPIINPTANEPIQAMNFWISKTYIHRIPLAIPKEAKDSLIKLSWTQSRAKLISDLKQKPKFYTVLYRNLGSTKKFFAPYELIKANQFANAVTTILEPHWELIESYKREIKIQLILIYVGMAILNVIAALIIAINR